MKRISFFLLALVTQAPSYCQTTSEGGLRTLTKHKDQFSFSSSSSASSRSSGSTSVLGGAINSGVARSAIVASLNPAYDSLDGNLFLNVRGTPRDYSRVVSIQRANPNAFDSQPNIYTSSPIDDKLKLLLTNNFELTEIIKPPMDHPLIPHRLQITPNLEKLNTALYMDNNLSRISGSGKKATVFNYVHEPSPLRMSAVSSRKLKIWQDNKLLAVDTSPSTTSTSNNTILLISKDSNNKVNTSVAGFSTNPNPNSGKYASLMVSASTAKTYPSVKILNSQSVITPEFAAKFGTTPEEIYATNNMPFNSSVAGVELIIPTDTKSIGSIDIIEDTPIDMIAAKYGVSKQSILIDNALPPSTSTLPAGLKLRIPGIGITNTTAPQPAKILAPAVETSENGAYTSFEITYSIKSSKLPLFLKQFLP